MDDHRFYPEEITERELPPCDVDKLDDILLQLKTTHATVRSKTLRDLAANDGAYIVKLLDLFDLCELDDDKAVLHRIFDIFYALVELCDRRLIEILLSDANFLSVVGVFGHNPGLIREMDFRSALEGTDGFKEVIPIDDPHVLDRVHMNFRIHVIKDNVLSRSLPDCSVIMLEHMVNENNYYILSYISDSENYWQKIKELIRDKETRVNGLGLLKEVIQLVRITRPLDKLPQRRDGFGAPPVFGTLINNLFGDGAIFEVFGTVLGSSESDMHEIELAVDILNILVFYQGPERLRTHLASEGRCIAPPASDQDRIAWKPGSSLFTALLVVFERYESTRVQMFTLLKEIFKVPLGHDDKFLSVLYPNYITWLLQPMKYASTGDGTALFALHDSIMELLTFCTEAHGYRVKYLFGRQPIASYVEQMLRAKNKLSVIQAVKFLRACVARAEAFFSRFLVQNDLFAPTFAQLELGKRNDCVVSSAILELLAFIEKTNLSSLVEHIYTKFYETYKDECPLVFEAIRLRYEDSFGAAANPQTQNLVLDKIKFVQQNGMDDDEEMYWEKDDEPADSFVPTLAKASLSEEDISGRDTKPLKLVDYNDDDDDEEDASRSSLKDGDLVDPVSSPPPSTSDSDATTVTTAATADDDDEKELKLPVRVKSDASDDAKSFFSSIVAQKSSKAAVTAAKKARSPKVKSMFQKISWKQDDSGASAPKPETASSDAAVDDAGATSTSNGTSDGDAGHDGETSALLAKRKLELEDAHGAESIVKKSKPGTPISSS